MLSQEIKVLIEKGWAIRVTNFPPTIGFDYPVQTETISVTGTACALNCAHCGGHYLEGMKNLKECQTVLAKEARIAQTDGTHETDETDEPGAATRTTAPTSFLISGGCTPDGRVPFLPHQDVLREVKTQARLNFHVGLIGDEEILALKELANVVSFDFVADQETIEEVYGLNKTPEDYRDVYGRLRQAVQVMPHLTLGLKGGEWRGEEKALDVLEELGLDGLVFLVFIPTAGTRYAERKPPAVEDVIAFLAKARIRFPHIPLILGCMRPKGKYRQILDEAAVALGINRIVLPTPGARALAEKRGLAVVKGEECCAL
ncbi:MAG: radical SAM protein [Desulfitobacteriaceae bacterium]|nr:radical SAM protein [Desulfitobacteriaceae bacterium]MDI6878928.1 radical SAM protein [Desulfitobacteriaceae bacterium]MDI6914860.1 radical SAM protein [Desulfitobacteriaceae bacterium]